MFIFESNIQGLNNQSITSKIDLNLMVSNKHRICPLDK